MRVLLLGLLLLLPVSGSAEPVDFGNPVSRWVEIAFEVSPRDRPGQIDTHYTPKIDAWLETVEAGKVRITIDRRDVEGILLADQNAIAVLQMADRGYVLDSGRIVAQGDSQSLLNDERLRTAYLGGGLSR